MHRNGVSQNGIARTLGINFRTVHKYMRLNEIPKLEHARLDYSNYLPDIRKDMANGVPLMEIYSHICDQGFKGCFKSFWNRFHNEAKSMKGEKNLEKQQQLQLKKRFSVLSPKKISIYLTYKDLNNIPTVTHRQQMIKLVEKNELIRTLYQLFLSFRKTLLSKHPERLDEWLNEALKTGIDKLKAFARSLKMDIRSVKNAIRFDYNSGMVEGCVNRLKNIKRQMYGRASLDLLKRKVILSNTG